MLKSTSVLLFIFLTTSIYCQKISHTLLSNSGGDSHNENIHLSVSIGESFIGMSKGNTHSLLTGFQQMEGDMSSSIFNVDGYEVEITMFPNPVQDVLFIYLDSEIRISNLKMRIYNLQGVVTHADLLQDMQSEIDISNLPPGMYVITLVSNQGSISSHKFIKS